MTCPFSPAGRSEERSRDADQQHAQEAARQKAAESGEDPPTRAQKKETDK